MAAIRVLICQQGRRKILRHWDENTDSLLQVEDWKESSILWPEGWLNDQPESMEVFLCLDGESLAEGYDDVFVKAVIKHAQESMWGARIYAVLDNEASLMDLLANVPTGSEEKSSRLFELLLENSVSDILQLPITPTSNFGEAAVRSRKRMEKLTVPDPGPEWKCLIRRPPDLRPDQETLLSPYLVRSLAQLKDENCLIVLQEKRENYMGYLKRILGHTPGHTVMVGIIDQIENPPRDLIDFCRERDCELIRFHGVVELYYFLRRLDRESIHHAKNTQIATSVRVGRNPTFTSHAPQLLITYSYLRGKTADTVAAANDVWELVRELDDTSKVKVYPAVKCVKLADMMEELHHILAWIHIGHGDDNEGLQQADDELFKSAEHWLNSFASYRSSLALALFSSCRSASVAKLFAASGAGVSIGFENEVHQNVCAHLTKRVVRKALHTNGSRDAILEAFEAGRKILEIEDRNALPIAFWARH